MDGGEERIGVRIVDYCEIFQKRYYKFIKGNGDKEVFRRIQRVSWSSLFVKYTHRFYSSSL